MASSAVTLESLKGILADAQEVWPGAVIAGGALRDWHMGWEPRDVDVFVPAGELQPHPLRWFPASFSVGGYGCREEVANVVTYDVVGCPWPVQVVHLLAPNDDVPFYHFVNSRIDFDFCRLVMPTPDGTFVTPEAMNAFRMKRATLLLAPDEASALRSLRRADKFRARYPDWTFDTSLANQFVEEIA